MFSYPAPISGNELPPRCFQSKYPREVYPPIISPELPQEQCLLRLETVRVFTAEPHITKCM